jgi:hypothetical protein
MRRSILSEKSNLQFVSWLFYYQQQPSEFSKQNFSLKPHLLSIKTYELHTDSSEIVVGKSVILSSNKTFDWKFFNVSNLQQNVIGDLICLHENHQ